MNTNKRKLFTEILSVFTIGLSTISPILAEESPEPTADLAESLPSSETPFYEMETASFNLETAGTLPEIFQALQRQFPNGSYWNHAIKSHNGGEMTIQSDRGSFTSQNDPCNTYEQVTWTPCQYSSNGHGLIEGTTNGYTCNMYDNGIQCAGYARLLFYKIHNEHVKTLSADVSNIQMGDYVKIAVSSGDHYAIVTGVDGDSITVTDCNKGGTCQIRWGGVYKKSQITGVYHGNSSTTPKTPSTNSQNFKVRYRANAGDAYGDMEDEVWETSSTRTLRKNTFIRPGYTFGGWYVFQEGSGWLCSKPLKYGSSVKTFSNLSEATANGYARVVYGEAGMLSNISAGNQNTFTCYAIWKPNTYILSYSNHQTRQITSGTSFTLLSTSQDRSWILKNSSGETVAAKVMGGALVYQVFQDQSEALRSGFVPVRFKSGQSLLSLPGSQGEVLMMEESEGVKEEAVDLFRLYNPNSGEHFYTAGVKERDALIKEGWRYEGVGWSSPVSSSFPVYRLYNPNAGDHHYTLSSQEKGVLVSEGWVDEGVGWYSSQNYTGPVYREYNPNAVSGSHNFTTDLNEHLTLIQLGWKDEGFSWFVE